MGDHKAARHHAERALALVRGAGLRQEEAHCLSNLGTVVRYVPHSLSAARAYYEQALHIYHQIGDLRGEGAVLRGLGVVVGMQGDYDRAFIYTERALRICREIGDRQGENHAVGLLGTRCLHLGDYGEAKDYYEQQLRIAREMGDPRSERDVLSSLGHTSTNLGNYAAARTYLERVLRTTRDTTQPAHRSALTWLALLLHSLGDDEAAYGYARQQAWQADHIFSGSRGIVLGHVLLGLGRLDEAADAYRQALALQREGDRHHLTVEPLAGLARVALVQEDHARATATVKEIFSPWRPTPSSKAQWSLCASI